ncbi:MAG: serine protein kinase PrkA [Myxococcales bacterium]|nr:serine protein kinase PrkA [Myxococcales bacterium]
MGSRDELERVSASVRDRFRAQKRVLSFSEYLEEVLAHPWRHSRDAARYMRDCFDHYGSYEVARPWGAERRFALFDQEFVSDSDQPGNHPRLVGQEELQHGFYRALGNFVREGRANRLVLMHGPNGSAKSTFAACVMRALEDYSSTDEGALYRFSWVFSGGVEERSIGFGSASKRLAAGESLAHLDADKIDAKLVSEIREHPLLLVPLEERRALLTSAYAEAGIDESPPDWLMHGRLGRKNAEVYDALLASYEGDLSRVLAHVQVERFYISRRYRTGAVTIGPQMTVDANERQITADHSIANLPAALSSLALYETQGELVDGGAGLIEYSDLLKRPLDAWKYLLLAIESGEVALTMSVLTVNSVLLASTNETHLEAFRQHPEYNSFRARLMPLRAGYLLDYKREQEIYDTQIVPQVRCHVTPHATEVAAMWAVLTRLLPSDSDRYEDSALGKVAADLKPMEKARAYAEGVIPRRLDGDETKVLRAGLARVFNEFEAQPIYEGITGASPREIRTLLLDAVQDPSHACLSPLAVMEQIRMLCEKGDYDFLQQKPEGSFHDHRDFLQQVRDGWLSSFDREVRDATGLVEEGRYEELFDRYIHHVSLWVKGERHRDTVTGDYSDPDEALMKRIEGVLDVDDSDDFRKNLINMIAAYAIDHPGEEIDNARIFPRYLEQVQEAYFADQRGRVTALIDDLLVLLTHEGKGLDASGRKHAEQAQKRLAELGYCEHCARTALGELRKERYA